MQLLFTSIFGRRNAPRAALELRSSIVELPELKPFVRERDSADIATTRSIGDVLQPGHGGAQAWEKTSSTKSAGFVAVLLALPAVKRTEQVCA